MSNTLGVMKFSDAKGGDAQRWIWTEHGMEPYRAHPLMQDVGGVFVTAEAYERLKGERDGAPSIRENNVHGTAHDRREGAE